MTTLRLAQTVLVCSLVPWEMGGSQLFQLGRGEGAPAYWSDMLLPHRNDYFTYPRLASCKCALSISAAQRW